MKLLFVWKNPLDGPSGDSGLLSSRLSDVIHETASISRLSGRKTLLWKSQGANKGQRAGWGRFPVVFQNGFDRSQFVVSY